MYAAALLLKVSCFGRVTFLLDLALLHMAELFLLYRSFIPVLCCIMAIYIENKLPTRKEVGSLVLLSIGVMIAVWEGAIHGSPHGIMLCIVGTVCNAAMMSTSGRLLSEKLDVLRLAFYTAPVSCIALFPFCYVREVKPYSWQ